MHTGTIERLISYYLENKKFKTEIERAMSEFFSLSNEGNTLMIEEKYEPFFIEWLVYDFRLSNGQGLLEDYYERNPRKLPLYEMQVYKNLQNNVYGLLEAQKIDVGEGLKVLVLNTNENFYVQEHSATFQLKKGNVFFGRVAKVGDHWELVGSDSFLFNIKLDSGAKKFFINKKNKLTPKDTVIFLKEPKEKFIDNNDDDIDKIKKEFDKLLKEIEVYSLVNTVLIQEWLEKIAFKNKPDPIINIIFCLTKEKISNSQMEKLVNLFQRFANNSPLKALKGKSPMEMSKTVEAGSKGFSFSVKKLGGKWVNHSNKAMDFLKDKDILKALDEFEETFKFLLKEETTNRYIYKFFSNLAVCNLALGGEYIARQLLMIALELNSNYKFASNLLSILDKRERIEQLAIPIRSVLEHAHTKELKEFRKKVKNYNDKDLCKAYYEISLADFITEWENSSAKKYYSFLKKLKINFDIVE